MARRKGRKRVFEIENLTIEDIAEGGKGVAKHDGMVVFVSKTAPGDVVDVLVRKKKKNFAEADPLRFHAYSDLRVEPFCEHFGTCGGCKWQHLDYQDQAQFKAKLVQDCMERIAKVEVGEFLPILTPEKNTFYRNKMEFSFSWKRWFTKEEIGNDGDLEARGLGFHIPGAFDKILDIEKCWLQEEPSNAIRLAIKKYAIEHDFEFYNPRIHEGFIRNMFIRSTTTGQWMVIVVF